METNMNADNTGMLTIDPVAYWKARSERAEKRLEAMEYVIAYANDIVETWPTITMRTLWKMTEKVATIKEALKQAL